MIKIDYIDGEVRISCETMDDVNSLTPIMSNFDTLTFKSSSIFCISPVEIDKLNTALIPIRSRLLITKEFKEWIALKRNPINPAVIKVGVVKSKIVQGSVKLPHKDIEECTRYFLKAAVNMDKYKSGKWDGFINLYHKWDHTFPTGLLEEVKIALTRKGIEFRVQYCYEREVPKEFDWKIKELFTPTSDQLEAVRLGTRTRGIIKAPTAMGKTSMIARYLTVEHSVPTLFIANRKTLLDSAAGDFVEGIKGLKSSDVIQIKDGWFGDTKLGPNVKDVKPIKAPIVVATIQSLKARLDDERTRPYLLDWLHNKCKFLMVDETQVVGTKVWDEVLDEVWAPYRIFLSATPRRTDGATIKLMAGSGPILYSSTASEQIEQGRLCELDIYYKTFDHKLFNENDNDVIYSDMYKLCIVENEARNYECVIKPTLEMLKEERHVLVLVQHIDHGHILKEMFIKEGFSKEDVMFIWGDTSDKIRLDTIDKFKKGQFKILIGSTIMDVGVNINIISGVILIQGGNSDITLIQRIGRGARTCDYEKTLGYTPKFIKDNNGIKVTKVYDVLDINTKFFHKQSRTRYYNASQEFGANRVHIVNGDKSLLNSTSKSRKRTDTKHIDQFSSQLAMLDEFRR